jgi:hypothetical protein
VYVADAQFLLDRGCGSGLPRYDQLSGPGEQTTGREHQAPTGRGEHPSRPGTSSVPGTTPFPATSSSAAGRRSSPC